LANAIKPYPAFTPFAALPKQAEGDQTSTSGNLILRRYLTLGAKILDKSFYLQYISVNPGMNSGKPLAATQYESHEGTGV